MLEEHHGAPEADHQGDRDRIIRQALHEYAATPGASWLPLVAVVNKALADAGRPAATSREIDDVVMAEVDDHDGSSVASIRGADDETGR